MAKLFIVLFAVLAAVHGRPAEQAPEIYKFDWSDCGSDGNRPLRMHTLSIKPDPVKIPGTAVVTFDLENKAEIANMDVKIKIEKKILLTYITVYSYTLKDLCSQVPAGTCPIAADRVSRENYEVPLPDLPSWVPGSLVGGQYRTTFTFKAPGTGQELGCLKVQIKLST